MSDAELPNGTPRQHHRRIAMFLLKFGCTGALLYIVFARVESAELLTKLKNLPLANILLSLLLLNLAQILSAGRMRYYFAQSDYSFSKPFSLAIYYTGALFNTVLPGGISGDGYKAWFLKKHLDIPVKTSVRRMLSERANGLCFLLFYALVLVLCTPAAEHLPGGRALVIAAMPALVACYLVSIRLLLKEDAATALGASRFSSVSQLCVMLSALPLFTGLAAEAPLLPDYLALFMVSCVMSVLPVSVGGAGVREATFFYGATYLGLNAELGVAASLAFFAVTTVTSLFGLLALKPLKRLAKEQLL